MTVETTCRACAEDQDLDLDDLELDYDEKCNEVVELQAELREAKLLAQQLGLRLQAVSAKTGKAPGAAVAPALPDGAQAACLVYEEQLCTLLGWLAQHTDLAQAEVLDVGFEVPIGGRVVHLQRVVQWKLTTAPGQQLRLSVPIEHHEAIAGLLAYAKAQDNRVDVVVARRFAATWDLAPGELVTATHVHAEPAVLLAHRGSTQGILVATWPTREALEAFHAMHAAAGTAPLTVGQRVEVEFEGQWYCGTVHSVDCQLGKARVRCDVDAPGVLTIAPLGRIRPSGAGIPQPPPGAVAVGTNGAMPPPAAPTPASRPRLATMPVAVAAVAPRPQLQHRRTRSAM